MALNKKQRKRIEMHFSKRKTPEQQREQRIAAGVRKAGRNNRSRRQWSPDDDEDFETFERMRSRDEAPPRDAPPARERPRHGVLSRPDPHDPRRELVLATGVDIAVVVAALRTPPLRPGLIDRFLVALDRGGVEPLICVNKVDLCDAAERARIEEILAPYEALCVPRIVCSAESGEGIDALRAHLSGSTCVFVGHSGVGKSSLVNALDPDTVRATGDVRRSDGKGRHTTTRTTTTELADGTRIIDTPGIRAFGLWQIDRRTLGAYFPEFEAPAATCRFSDCTHRHEPACGVRAAVDDRTIPRSRYDSYLRLFESLPE